MTDRELISEEVLEILRGKDEGLTAQAIYDQSRIAMSLAEVTGALTRLRNGGQLVRGTDKCWRTMNAAERGREQEQKEAKHASVVIAADRAVASAKEPGSGFADIKDLESEVDAVIKKDIAVAPLAAVPMDKAKAVEAVKKAARLDFGKGKLFSSIDPTGSMQEASGELEHQIANDVATSPMDAFIDKTKAPAPAADDDWLIYALDEEFDAAQARLDRYAAEIGDEVLIHLVAMCFAASNALDAARRAR